MADGDMGVVEGRLPGVAFSSEEFRVALWASSWSLLMVRVAPAD